MNKILPPADWRRLSTCQKIWIFDDYRHRLYNILDSISGIFNSCIGRICTLSKNVRLMFIRTGSRRWWVLMINRSDQCNYNLNQSFQRCHRRTHLLSSYASNVTIIRNRVLDGNFFQKFRTNFNKVLFISQAECNN